MRPLTSSAAHAAAMSAHCRQPVRLGASSPRAKGARRDRAQAPVKTAPVHIEVVHRRGMQFDPFGFPLDQEYVPSSRTASLSKEHAQRHSRFWAQQQQQHEGGPPRTQELRDLVHGGIPHAYRAAAWNALLSADGRRRRSPGHYESIATDAQASSQADVQAISELILKDADRTWPRHKLLNTTSLHRVLLAFARHEAATGYCQGLNQVAACLLLVNGGDEEAAFWCLVSLVERLPSHLWSETLRGCRVEQAVLTALIERRWPWLNARLRALRRLTLDLYSTSWFLALFVGDLPLETALRVWDMIALEDGSDGGDGGDSGDGGAADVVLAASLALLSVIEGRLRRCTRAGQLGEMLHAAPRELQPDSAAGMHRCSAARRAALAAAACATARPPRRSRRPGRRQARRNAPLPAMCPPCVRCDELHDDLSTRCRRWTPSS